MTGPMGAPRRRARPAHAAADGRTRPANATADGRTMRILVAGVGNVLRQDDGFGVEVARRLAADGLPAQVEVQEFGISGLSLVQELMKGYEGLIIVDAWDRGQPPGQVFVVEPGVPDPRQLSPQAFRDYLADSHYTDPSKALFLAREIGVLPSTVRLVACQPAETEGYGMGLSPEVARGVAEAAARVQAILKEWLSA